MIVLTWNLEWARPGSKRESIIRDSLRETDADIICLTEAFSATLPGNGHIIEGGVGNPVGDRMGAKKVILWSRNPWTDWSTHESFTPPGRIVSGTTITEAGPVGVVGLCIPWSGSNTARFGGTRRPWEDHLHFLKSLNGLLKGHLKRTLVLGDFNQRLPRKRQPVDAFNALEEVLARLILPTRNFRSEDGHDTIDHIAHTADLQASKVQELRRHRAGLRLTDHFGVMASIQPA